MFRCSIKSWQLLLHVNAEHTAHGLSAAVSYQEPAHISVKGPCYFTVDQSLVDDPAHKLMAIYDYN